MSIASLYLLRRNSRRVAAAIRAHQVSEAEVAPVRGSALTGIRLHAMRVRAAPIVKDSKRNRVLHTRE